VATAKLREPKHVWMRGTNKKLESDERKYEMERNVSAVNVGRST